MAAPTEPELLVAGVDAHGVLTTMAEQSFDEAAAVAAGLDRPDLALVMMCGFTRHLLMVLAKHDIDYANEEV